MPAYTGVYANITSTVPLIALKPRYAGSLEEEDLASGGESGGLEDGSRIVSPLALPVEAFANDRLQLVRLEVEYSELKFVGWFHIDGTCNHTNNNSFGFTGQLFLN